MDSPVCEGEYMELFEDSFIRDMPKPFHRLQSELLHLLKCLGVEAQDGMGCLNSM